MLGQALAPNDNGHHWCEKPCKWEREATTALPGPCWLQHLCVCVGRARELQLHNTWKSWNGLGLEGP